MQTRLTPEAIRQLKQQYPMLRDDYFEYLLQAGWGETEVGPIIFEGPTAPEVVYGPRKNLATILLLAHDFQGYCFGFNYETDCYGEVSGNGSWQPWPCSAGFSRYVTEREQKAN